MYVFFRMTGSLGIILLEEQLIMQVNDMKRFLIYEESNGKSSLDKYMRSVSCGYELILCDYIMSMLWIGYIEGYVSQMKAV